MGTDVTVSDVELEDGRLVTVRGYTEFDPDGEIVDQEFTVRHEGALLDWEKLSQADQDTCSEELRDACWERDLRWEEDYEHDDRYDHPIDGVGFADPGGRSALRAATADNPRNLPCPECGTPDVLTPLDRAHSYVCDRCADAAECGW